MKSPSIKHLALILCLLLSSLSSFAQQLKFSIVEFRQDPLDLTAQDVRKLDVDGNVYAVIKVISNNDEDNLNDYTFNFGKLNHIVEAHDDQLWIYVQCNAKQVTITRSGYKPVRNYDLGLTIQAGKTYQMLISSEAQRILTQMVKFNVKPSTVQATVLVKSTERGSAEENIGVTDETGSVASALKYGRYTYRITAPNYHTAEGQIEVGGTGTLTEEVTLRPNFATITLNVDSDADIYINNELKGHRTWTGILKSGTYQVECRQLNHTSSTQSLEVFENLDQSITLTPPTPILGTLSINSTPLGAQITIDGNPISQLTPCQIDILIGQHKVTVSKDGYSTKSVDVTVNRNQTAQANVVLDRSATVRIITTPADARVQIDGTFLPGKSPYQYTGQVGQHSIKITCPNYKTIESSINVGQKNEYTFPMTTSMGELTIYSNASCVEVDGERLSGSSPFTYRGPVGSHTIKVKGGDWQSKESRTVMLGTTPQTITIDIYYIGDPKVKKTDFYIEAGISYMGGHTYASGTMGFHAGGFNMEASYHYRIKYDEVGVFWGHNTDPSLSNDCSYTQDLVIDGKLGVGIRLGRRVKFTPQIGCRYTGIICCYNHSHAPIRDTYCLSGTFGMRMYFAFSRHFGFSIIPEYAFGVSKADGYKILSENIKDIKNMAEGFNIRAAFALTF